MNVRNSLELPGLWEPWGHCPHGATSAPGHTVATACQTSLHVIHPVSSYGLAPLKSPRNYKTHKDMDLLGGDQQRPPGENSQKTAEKSPAKAPRRKHWLCSKGKARNRFYDGREAAGFLKETKRWPLPPKKGIILKIKLEKTQKPAQGDTEMANVKHTETNTE